MLWTDALAIGLWAKWLWLEGLPLQNTWSSCLIVPQKVCQPKILATPHSWST